MKLTPPRLTVRRMMGILAFLALCLALIAWMQRRARHYTELDRFHMGRWESFMNDASASGQQLAEYHSRLAAKYRRVSERPWLPLESDPPDPN